MEIVDRHSSPQFPRARKKRWLWPIGIVGIGIGLALFLRENDPARRAQMADLVKPGAAAGFNLLLITLDTTRPDRLGCYGYKDAFTPAIDSLLQHGVRFDDAVTCVPLTLPSHATILTGLYPPTLGVRDNGTYELKPAWLTLTEILKEKGYDTAAFVASFILDKRFGLDQGFDVYDFKVAEDSRRGADSLENQRRADGVSNAFISWIRGRRDAAAPFFAWLHYYDPHHPYDAPSAKEARFEGRHPYDAEIAFMDRHIKRALDAVDQHGLRQKTLIVLVSDHGESMSEHREPHHGIFIYESTMRAALLFSSPALFSGSARVDDRIVGTVDVLPTTLGLLGIPLPERLEGISLLADAPPDRALYMESYYPREKLGCSPLYALRRHTDKFILAPKPEYYDLRADPRELKNAYETTPPGLSELKDQLESRVAEWDRDGVARAGARRISAAEQQALESLGYAGTIDETHSTALPDPKDQLPIINQMNEVEHLRKEGKYQEALAVALEVVSQTDGYDGPVLTAAWLYVKLDQRAKAIELLEPYARRHPSADVRVQLARDLAAEKRWDEMEAALSAAEAVDPRRGSIAALRGDRAFEQGKFVDAAQLYEKAILLDSERIGPEVRERLIRAKNLSRETDGK